jgi:hypothetical protein
MSLGFPKKVDVESIVITKANVSWSPFAPGSRAGA